MWVQRVAQSVWLVKIWDPAQKLQTPFIMANSTNISVLPRMKCPHELQPHQIQGLDCVKIFPVVQWLVKKAMERREEMAQYIR